jgi:UDP-2,3-diacylglucosamine pyrophosphatase LpxH
VEPSKKAVPAKGNFKYSAPIIEIPPAPDYALKIRHKYFAGWEQTYLLTADEHLDSPECYINLWHNHMREAKEKNALVVNAGDMFDVISGRHDKRGSKGTIREEHSKVNYIDRVVDWGADELKPYADQLVYVGTGNHEMSVLVNTETDVTARVLEKVNSYRSKDLPPIYRAGFTGWIRFMFENPKDGGRFSWNMKIEHGTGGNSPVSKGVLEAHRRSARVEGATFLVSGHIHERWHMEHVVETLNSSTGRIEQRPYEHIQLGSYKRDFRTDGVGTWFMMKMGSTKPIGGKWLRFWCDNGKDVKYVITNTWVPYSDLTKYLRKSKIVTE